MGASRKPLKRSPFFEGHFGRMFRALPMAKFGTTDDENIKNLTGLGSAMSADFDPPKDGKDDEESGIPALYTYLGQFIDHDITFDPASVLQKQNDPDALVDFRTPALDLDNVYGRGPSDQPYMYDGGNAFLLGDALQGGDPRAKDLPRNTANPRRALIGDPRNDENTIVSQLQGAVPALPQSHRGRESGPRAGRDPAARPVSLPIRRVERLLAPDRPLECPQGTEDRSAI